MSVHKVYEWRLLPFGPLNVKDTTRFLRKERKRFYKRLETDFPFIAHLEHFEFLYILAQGSFGKIILAKEKSGQTLHAVKALKKKTIVRKKEVKEALNEKRILQSLNSPFCVTLDLFCQDNSYLYLFMSFGSGGDLFTKLRKDKRFEESLTRFYVSQVVLALEYLHHLDLIYRDLKPENILLDHLGYLKLTDFGFAKVVETRTYTFCGTPDYISPEMIKGQGYGRSVDWWALGVLAFEMIAGYPPFTSRNSMERYEKILVAKYSIPAYLENKSLNSFVIGLLQVDVTKRLGNLRGGAEDVKKHKWLRTIDWYSLFNRRLTPPFVPPNVGISHKVFPKLRHFKSLNVSEVDHYPRTFDEF